jgi:predicted O-methyltransferase YrrM/glycosyltransferase involved in cell wall biosynthesis
MNWKEVSGFFDSDLVYKLATKTFPDKSIFVEIGSWMGKSASCLGQLVKESQKNIRIFAVDTFEGSIEHTEIIKDIENQSTSLLEIFKNNIKLCEVDGLIIPIQGKSVDVASQFEDGSIDFIFIDASHDYENVLADINAWYPKLKPGGLIAGDDYAGCWGGVIEAVNEYFIDKTIFFLNGNLNYPYSQKIWHWCHFKPKGENIMNITLYTIAKNEEKNIEKFIENSKKFSHTVVVDTGSTDNTVQLLRDAGIEVYEHPQTKGEFDFSIARNTALSYIKTEWAFSIDFNENIDDLYLDGFDVIQDEFTCFKHLRFDDNGTDEPTQSNEVHVRFHRVENYKWANAVHEMPVFVASEKFPQESSVDTTIKITKKIKKSISKEIFYFDICEREYKKDPTNWYYIWFIFNHYFNVGNYQKAVEFGQEYLNVSKPYFDTFRIIAFIKCSISLVQLQDLSKSANYAFHAVSEAMNMGEPYLSSAFIHLNQFAKAIGNPNVTVFATGFNPETLNSPERIGAIKYLYDSIVEEN